MGLFQKLLGATIVITNSGEFTRITPLTTGNVTHQDKLLLVK